MKHFTTDLVQAIVAKQDVTEVFRSHQEKAMNHLLETELTAFLDYESTTGRGKIQVTLVTENLTASCSSAQA